MSSKMLFSKLKLDFKIRINDLPELHFDYILKQYYCQKPKTDPH